MRIAKHVLGALCLLAALLLAGVWVRSYWMGDLLSRAWYAREGEYHVRNSEILASGRGELVWRRIEDGRRGHVERDRHMRDGPEVPLTRSQFLPPSLFYTTWYGFAYQTEVDSKDAPRRIVRTRVIAVPTWLPLLIVAVPGGLWLRGVVRRRRRGAHDCPACGYDLRASPDRCPECGRPAAAGAQ